MMLFIETFLFTKQISNYLSDEEYGKLQEFMIETPDAGDLIQGTKGLRKLRWKTGNKGKRGGVRVIYYWQVSKDQIYMMTIYAKNEMKDLSAKEKKLLSEMVEKW